MTYCVRLDLKYSRIITSISLVIVFGFLKINASMFGDLQKVDLGLEYFTTKCGKDGSSHNQTQHREHIFSFKASYSNTVDHSQ